MPKPKQITDRKRQANRENARKSTGPRTEGGKARSAANATTHGLIAQNLLMPADHLDENPDDFKQLLDDLIQDYDAQTRAEQLAVERIAAAYWRLRRAYKFETQAIRDAARKQKRNQALHVPIVPGDTPSTEPPAIPNQPDLDRLIRYESIISRELNRATVQLKNLHEARKGREENTEKPEQTQKSQPPTPVNTPSEQSTEYPTPTDVAKKTKTQNEPTKPVPHNPAPTETPAFDESRAQRHVASHPPQPAMTTEPDRSVTESAKDSGVLSCRPIG